jgi:hypothetical protein
VEPISPELALVDAELAARARQSLPLPGDVSGYGRPSSYLRPPAPVEPAPQGVDRRLPTVEPARTAPRPTGRRRLARTVTVAATTFVLALAAPIVWSFIRNPRATLDPGAGGSVRSSEAPVAGSTPAPSTERARKSRGGTRRPRSSERSSTESRRRSRAQPAARGPGRASATTHAQHARGAVLRLRWQAVFGARAYRVALHRLLRGNRERAVLHVTTRVPHVTLPLHWRQGGHRYRLGPGRYRWRLYVVRGGRTRAGTPVASHEVVVR